MRARWDAGNHLLHLEYDEDASDANQTWTQLAAWQLDAGATHWGMSPGDSFLITLNAESVNASVYDTWQIYADNFEVASALPTRSRSGGTWTSWRAMTANT